MNFQPVIKWSGSKKTQSEIIVNKFPNEIDTYYEPFVGGGSILRRLMSSNKHVESYMCSDINEDLINLWKAIRDDPYTLFVKYGMMWKQLNIDENISRKKDYYNMVRARVNEDHQPEDFLFISRTTVNGLIRYNNSGNLNNSFHLTRNGINPETLSKIVLEWSKLLKENNVTFYQSSYEKIKSTEYDFLYLDPPYAATKGMYNGVIDYSKFFEWLRNQRAEYALSFDGKTNKEDYTYAVPEDLYSEHEYIFAGNSSFRRIIGKSSDTDVSESIYLKYNSLHQFTFDEFSHKHNPGFCGKCGVDCIYDNDGNLN